MMIEKNGDTFRVSGPMTMASVAQLLDEASKVIDGISNIDFSQVSDVDSAGISVLLQWIREAKAKKRDLALNNLPENLKSLATVYGVMEFLVPQK